MWSLYNFLVTLAETWILFHLAGLFLSPRMKSAHPVWFLAAAVLSELLQQFNVLYSSRNTGLIICMALDVFLLCLLFRGTLTAKIQVVLLFYALSLAVEIWTISACAAVIGYSMSEPLSGNGAQIAVTITAKVVTLSSGKKLAINLRRSEASVKKTKHFRLAHLAGCSAAILAAVFIVPVDRPFDVNRIAATTQLASLGLLLTLALVPQLLLARQARAAAEKTRQETGQVKKLLLKYEQDLNEYAHRLNSREHDLRHHLELAHTLMSTAAWQEEPQNEPGRRLQDQPGEASQKTPGQRRAFLHMSKVADRLFSAPPDFIDTGNAEANAVLHAFLKRVSDKVRLEVKGGLTASLFVDSLDLCVLLSNLLENSFEAVEASESGSGQVILVLHQTKEGLFIKTSNPIDETVKNVFASKKNLRQFHGYGMKRIKEIVNQYEGVIQTDRKDGLITFYVYLKDTNPASDS